MTANEAGRDLDALIAVNEAREAVSRWGQGVIECPTNYGPRSRPHWRAYKRAGRWQDRDIGRLIEVIRADERKRYAALVEAVELRWIRNEIHETYEVLAALKEEAAE